MRRTLWLFPFALFSVAACRDQTVDIPPVTYDPAPDPSVDYTYNKWFDGLEEYVVVHKSPEGVTCTRADGRVQDCLDVEAEDKKAYYEKYGAMSKPLFQDCATKFPPDKVLSLGIRFYVKLPPPPADFDTDARIVDGVRQNVIEKVIAAGGQIADASFGDPFPAMDIFGTCAVAMKLARTEGITSVFNAVLEIYGDVNAGSTGATPSVTDTASDSIFSAYGYSGKNQALGILGGSGDRLGLFAEHSAFSFSPAPPTYSSPPASCRTASDCSGNANDLEAGYRCIDFTCRDPHDTAVASIAVTGKLDGPYNAASSQVFYYNTGETVGLPDIPPGTKSPACSPSQRKGVKWLAQRRVSASVESFDCLQGGYPLPSYAYAYASAARVDGYAEDFYARRFNLFTVRAAGNSAKAEVYGGGKAKACPFTRNSLCVGGTGANREMYCRSSFGNDGDREEPDVVGYAGPSCATSSVADPGPEVASMTGKTSWTNRVGTSFAAPNVAALAMLFKERCPDIPPATHTLRTIFKVGAYDWNPEGSRYETPSALAPDARDGAGHASAEGIMRFCKPDGSSSGIDASGVALADGKPTDVNGKDCADCGKRLAPLALTAAGPKDGRLYKEYATFGASSKRLRVGFNWDACAIAEDGSGPAPLGIDFDIFLIDAKNNRVVYSSQSADDNSEGFDVPMNRWGDVPLRVVVGYPANAKTCDGGTTEPATFAWMTY